MRASAITCRYRGAKTLNVNSRAHLHTVETLSAWRLVARPRSEMRDFGKPFNPAPLIVDDPPPTVVDGLLPIEPIKRPSGRASDHPANVQRERAR